MRSSLPMLRQAGLVLFCGVALASAQDPPVKPPGPSLVGKTFAKDVRPLMENYCWDCHGDGSDKGDVNFDKYADEASVLRDRKLWAGVQFHIDQWTMPPAKKKTQPTPEEREFLATWLDHLLNPVDPDNPDPGRVTLRRLNRVEYNNTVRDLLGVDLRPADDFPEDDTGYGFDNIGDVLALPPILMERYLIAADRVLTAAIPASPPPSETTRYGPAEMHEQGLPDKAGRLLAFNGRTTIDHSAIADGEYVVRVKTWQDQAGSEPAKLRLFHDDNTVSEVKVQATSADKAETVEARVKLTAGSQKLGVAFLNDFYDPDLPDVSRRDRNLYLGSIEVEGPLKARPSSLNAVTSRIFSPGEKAGETEAGARAVLQNFANRAFRRAAIPAEVDRLVTIYRFAREQKEEHRDALRIAMKAVMISPYFIYRIEWQPDANDPRKIVDLDEFALATRLSYWLWSSTPDDELLSLAFRGELRKNLPQQVQRMLADPKSVALAENFAGQWLELRTLNVATPDKALFPGYSPELAADMREETNQLFLHILRENRSVVEFLSADYTFLNERLAKFYGIPGVTGDAFQKVALKRESGRGGILTHAGVLTVTSLATRTSPVKRGKWVLENLLDITPPPPPPNVPALAEGGAELHGTLRQRMEAHRNNPGCASCHALMDPIGFGLENFDAIGRWRDKDGDSPVDAAGVLTTGQNFANASELTSILLTDRRDAYLHAIVRKMLTYSLGRGLEPYDRPAVDGILARMARDRYSMQSLILGITESLPFQKRRGDAFQKNRE